MPRLLPITRRKTGLGAGVIALGLCAGSPAHAYYYLPGDLVVSIYGNGDGSGPYTDNQASPIVLKEVTTSGATVGQIVLPQTGSVANGVTQNAISGEFGSSSEGTLQLSANGQYLTIAGYGVSASTFNANAQGFGGGQKTCITSGAAAANCYPLAQTTSVAGTPGSTGSGVATATVVPRVVALIDPNGKVDTSTALTGVFNENNPRSVATMDGSTLYLSGQGLDKNDTATQGVFVAKRGATAASAQIYGTVDTRTVSIQNNRLYTSTDSTAGSGVTENISAFGAAGNLPTASTAPTVQTNIKSQFAVPSLNTLNYLDQASLPGNTAYTTTAKTKGNIYLSPENYFFANATTLYVADSGAPKGDNNGASKAPQGLSDGGLQKWSLVSGTWQLDYTLAQGLNLVSDTTGCGSNQVGCGTTGLIGLTGEVLGDSVYLYATNATLGDLDPTYLFGITDQLDATTMPTGESFTTLLTADPGTNIRGVSFTPTTEPASLLVMASGLAGATLVRRHRRKQG